MITIVDYQMGNLRSVQKGFERVGSAALISSDPEQVRTADKLVLPGVGAFGDAMHELRERGLTEAINEAIRRGAPFLGICLGLQLLFETSDEGGCHAGLGILPGKVVRFRVPPPLKVPHMGWNQAHILQPAPLLAGVPSGTYFYFVHSYYVAPADGEVVAVQTTYDQPFCAMVWKDNVLATQFHPEKSQAAGLKLLSNFAQWRG